MLQQESRKEASEKQARLGASRPAVIAALRQKYGDDPGKWTCEDKTIFHKDVFKDVFTDSNAARDITAFVDAVMKQCNDLYCNDASQYAPQQEDCAFTGFNGDVWVCYEVCCEASQRLAIKYLVEVKSTTLNVAPVKWQGNSKYKHSVNTEFSQLWFPAVYGFTGKLTLATFLQCLFVGRYVMTVFVRSLFAAHLALQLKTKRIQDNIETPSAPSDDQGWLRSRLIRILHGKTEVFQSDVRIGGKIAPTGYRLQAGVWADGTRRNNSHAVLHGGHAVPWMMCGTNVTSRSQQDSFACSNMSQATRVQLQVVSSSSVVEPCACISVEVLDSSIITARTSHKCKGKQPVCRIVQDCMLLLMTY